MIGDYNKTLLKFNASMWNRIDTHNRQTQTGRDISAGVILSMSCGFCNIMDHGEDEPCLGCPAHEHCTITLAHMRDAYSNNNKASFNSYRRIIISFIVSQKKYLIEGEHHDR